MQQEKIGCLLRELRKEKGMTQEQMAELLGVTNRTVSRWENGINMPDISILVEISSYFEVGILELIEGERKQDTMITENNKELKKIANYADEQKSIVLRNVHRADVVGIICWFMSGLAMSAYVEYENNCFLLLQIIFLAVTGAMLVGNIFYATGISNTLQRCKKKYRIIMYLEILLLVIMLIFLCKDIYLILMGVI